MKLVIKAAAVSALIALAACSGGADTPAEQAEQNSDNMSEMMSEQADNLSEAADEMGGNMGAAMENRADALENASEAEDERNEQGVVDEAQ